MNTQYKQKIIKFYQAHKRMPTYSEMATLFGFKSKNAVYRLVSKMITVGLVTKDRLGKLLPTDIFNSLPLLGTVKAGFPASTEEVSDTINIEDYLIDSKDGTYILQVDGDSMIDAHIADGDMVIAYKTKSAKDGDIVIALVDGEHTMKYYRHKSGQTWLEPANKHFKPIYPKYQLEVEAVIKGVVRKY